MKIFQILIVIFNITRKTSTFKAIQDVLICPSFTRPLFEVSTFYVIQENTATHFPPTPPPPPPPPHTHTSTHPHIQSKFLIQLYFDREKEEKFKFKHLFE